MEVQNERFSRAREIVETCLRHALQIGTDLPRDDEDWIESGLLYSMDVVEVQSCIERAANIPDLFAEAGDLPVTTIRSAIEAVQKGLSARAEHSPEEVELRASKGKRTAALVGWGVALGSAVVPIAKVEREFGLASGTLKDRAGIETVSRASDEQSEVFSGGLRSARSNACGWGLHTELALYHRNERNVSRCAFVCSFITRGSVGASAHVQVLDIGGSLCWLAGTCLAIADAPSSRRWTCRMHYGHFFADVHSRISCSK